MRNWDKSVSVFLVLVLAFLAACGGKPISSAGTGTGGQVPFNMTVTDAPPIGLGVLSFQITLTSATLQPGNIALISSPQTIELTQLATRHALFASLNIAPGNYTSLVLTFANPVTTISNAGTALASQPACAANALCTYSLSLSTTTVTISSSPFPLAVSSGTPVGLLLDLNLSALIQSDGVSVDPSAGNAVLVSSLPSAQATTQLDTLADLTGQVSSVTATQMVLKTASGSSVTVILNNSTAYMYPSNVCAANNATCVQNGEIVTVQASLLGNGNIVATEVDFEDSASAQDVEGMIVSITPGSSSTSFQMVVHQVLPASSSIATGDIATVTIPNSGATFRMDNGSFTLPSGVSFATPTDLVLGQEVMAQIGQGTSGLTIDSGQLILRITQIPAEVLTVDTGAAYFTLTKLAGLFTNASPTNITQIKVQSSSQTDFINPVNSEQGVAGVGTSGQPVAVGGLMFNTVGAIGYPTIAAETVRVIPVSQLTP